MEGDRCSKVACRRQPQAVVGGGGEQGHVLAWEQDPSCDNFVRLEISRGSRKASVLFVFSFASPSPTRLGAVVASFLLPISHGHGRFCTMSCLTIINLMTSGLVRANRKRVTNEGLDQIFLK